MDGRQWRVAFSAVAAACILKITHQTATQTDLNKAVGGLLAPICSFIHSTFFLAAALATLRDISASDLWFLLSIGSLFASSRKQASAQAIICRSQAGFLSSTAYMCGYMRNSDALDDLLLAAEDGLELPGVAAPA